MNRHNYYNSKFRKAYIFIFLKTSHTDIHIIMHFFWYKHTNVSSPELARALFLFVGQDWNFAEGL